MAYSYSWTALKIFCERVEGFAIQLIYPKAIKAAIETYYARRDC